MTLSRLKREGRIFLETPNWKRAPSLVEGRIFGFFSSCGIKLVVPLELQWASQGPARGASGNSSLHPSCEWLHRIPLQSLPRLRSSSGFEAGTSGFLSSADMELVVPLDFLQCSKASSRVEICMSALLSSCKRSVRLPVGLT